MNSTNISNPLDISLNKEETIYLSWNLTSVEASDVNYF